MSGNRHNDLLIPLLTILSDIVAIEAAFLLSYELRFSSFFTSIVPLRADIPELRAYICSSFVVIPVWLIIFRERGMYGARRRVYPLDEFSHVVKSVTIGMLIVMGIAFFYRGFSYSRVVFALAWGLSIVLLFAGRWIMLAFEKGLYRRGRELRNAVLIGTKDAARRIAEILQPQPELGYKLLGYFGETERSVAIPLLEGLPCLGTIDTAPGFLHDENVEVAFIAVGAADHQKREELLRQCEGLNIEFLLVPDLLELMTSRVRVLELEGIPLLRVKEIPITTWGRILKRAFDLVVASVILLITSPIMAVVALAVKLGSRGPVLYHQERVGLDGKAFNVIKFRTMAADAEKRTGPVWATKDDPRVTRVGKSLRRTSLDELPQLLNVIKGDMSLVGPRPERAHFVEQFSERIPKYLDRHRLKTGMTGWAQVNGLRGNTPIEERTKYDIYYIENWSLWFDVKIILKTIVAVLKTKNAY